jgi:hypothetical protein
MTIVSLKPTKKQVAKPDCQEDGQPEIPAAIHLGFPHNQWRNCDFNRTYF